MMTPFSPVFNSESFIQPVDEAAEQLRAEHAADDHADAKIVIFVGRLDDFFRRSDKEGIKMDKEINENVKKTKKMLLHVCCAPCSSHVLSVLYEEFDITAFFYNPNITEKEEYEKRIEELKRFTQEAEFARNVVVCDGAYEPEKFYAIAKGLEKEPERGRRCYKCYELRLEETARYAKEHGFDIFTTTLSISPHKNAAWLNEIGERMAEK